MEVWARGESLERPCCGLASTYLEHDLKEEGFNPRMYSSKVHIYLKVDGWIVDPTIRQFFLKEATVPTIFVGDEKDLAQVFNSKERWFPGNVKMIYTPEKDQEEFLRTVRSHYL